MQLARTSSVIAIPDRASRNGSVVLDNLCRTYGDAHAVKQVSLAVGEGELVVLLGPSGCGKTTTLRMVAGFVQPSSGRVLIGGEDVTFLVPRLRNIGMVFQNYALFPNMTVADNIAFGLRQHRTPRAVAAARVNELLNLVQLAHKRDSFIGSLSGGQQQRVALARALAVSPRVLLMDEPLGALDQNLRETMQDELRRMQRELNVTTILVTHDQHEAMSLADRIVVMDQGRVQQIGTPEQLYQRPANRFVAEFVGRNNLLNGTVAEVGATDCTIALAGGWTVHAIAAAVRTGDRVSLVIRPECLRIVANAGASECHLQGQLTDRRFLGNLVHYKVRVATGQDVLVEAHANTDSPEMGGSVTLAWDPASAVVVAACADAE
jgi:spermidine/putrescine ABC transporter ATP-binding subunit